MASVRSALAALAAGIALALAAPAAAAEDAAAPDEGSPPDPLRATGSEDVVPAPAPDRVLRIVPEVVEGKPPPAPALLRRIGRIDAAMDCAPAFFADTDLRLRVRSFVFDRLNPDESRNEAWALGGWIQYLSGWAGDLFSVGATLYTSQPLWAPEDRDGTSILAPGQEETTVLGQAFARLRWRDHLLLTAWRQSIDDGYLNPQDNRMIPNTFEAVTLKGKVCDLGWHAAYVWGVKPRNLDTFRSMSEQAGASGPDEGLWLGSLTFRPHDAWEIHAATYYVPEVFNTAFGRVKFTPTIHSGLEGRFGLQATDQRSVGEERLGGFRTWNVGAAGALKWRSGLLLGAAVHVTGEDANIRSPYGTWPGWLSMIETDFDRAGETAWGVAGAWDFGAGGPVCVPGLTARVAYVRGTGRVDPASGAGLPTTWELDVDVIWDVAAVKGLQLRLRNAYVDSDGPVLGWQVRFIVNYELELL